jgi:hypothetical protein
MESSQEFSQPISPSSTQDFKINRVGNNTGNNATTSDRSVVVVGTLAARIDSENDNKVPASPDEPNKNVMAVYASLTRRLTDEILLEPSSIGSSTPKSVAERSTQTDFESESYVELVRANEDLKAQLDDYKRYLNEFRRKQMEYNLKVGNDLIIATDENNSLKYNNELLKLHLDEMTQKYNRVAAEKNVLKKAITELRGSK